VDERREIRTTPFARTLNGLRRAHTSALRSHKYARVTKPRTVNEDGGIFVLLGTNLWPNPPVRSVSISISFYKARIISRTFIYIILEKKRNRRRENN